VEKGEKKGSKGEGGKPGKKPERRVPAATSRGGDVGDRKKSEEERNKREADRQSEPSHVKSRNYLATNAEPERKQRGGAPRNESGGGEVGAPDCKKLLEKGLASKFSKDNKNNDGEGRATGDRRPFLSWTFLKGKKEGKQTEKGWRRLQPNAVWSACVALKGERLNGVRRKRKKSKGTGKGRRTKHHKKQKKNPTNNILETHPGDQTSQKERGEKRKEPS